MGDTRQTSTTRQDQPQVVLRPHRAGDIGWVVSMHGELYATQFGWDISFEALVAEIGAQFLKTYDASREHCWIAELDGERAGSVFLVDAGHDNVAKLRLLIVSPHAQGHGIGKRLVNECVAFARAKNYSKITLWTQSMLGAARHLYEAAGFQCVASEAHHSFGHDLVGETWELAL